MFTSRTSKLLSTGSRWLSSLLRGLGAAALVAVLLSSAQIATAQQSVLKEAKQKYQFAEYEQATSLFQKVADNQQADVALRRDALRYLARTYIAQGKKSDARSAIEDLVATNPPSDYLEPDVEPPAVMDLYYKVQKQESGSYKVQQKQGLQTLAVMDFTNNSITRREDYEGLRKGLPAIMINNLTGGTDLQVIERERIEWLLNELKLQKQSGKVDQSTAVRTGKLLGANAVVFGSFIATQDKMNISARVVKVETGEVMFGDQVQGSPDEFFNLIRELSQKVTKSINVEMEDTKLGSGQTKSLDAMMAYSDGLSLLEAGKYREAQQKFQQAVNYDEDFEKARKKMKSLKPMVASLESGDGGDASSLKLMCLYTRSARGLCASGFRGTLSCRIHASDHIRIPFVSYLAVLSLFTSRFEIMTTDPTVHGGSSRRTVANRLTMRRGIVLGLIAVFVGLSGCGGPSVTMNQDPSKFEEEESRLESRLSDHPDDAEALRDLGSIYLRTDRPSQAYDALKKAYSQRPDDPKVLFYLGLASEQVGRRQAALKLFSQFDEVPEDSKFRTLMEGRYEWLSRQQAQRTAQQLVAEEEKRPGNVGPEISSDVVAVVPMQYQGNDEQYQALGRGLAEMFTTDLSNVGRLQVVERVRLQALLDELKLAQSEYVDQSTAPRVGRLLGAGRLVGGSYLVTGDEQLRLQVTLVDATTGERVPQLENQRASLENLFDLQTRVTFSIVDQLGVDLTAQERAAIEEVPTQNIQAFLAYSRGLMEEDRGNFGLAAQHYQQAQQLDPDFQQAQEAGARAKSVQAGGGSQAEALSSAEGEGGGQQQSGSSINLVDQRLQSMGAGTGSMMTGDGEAERDPAQESTEAEEENVLDDPPSPPSSGTSGSGSQ